MVVDLFLTIINWFISLIAYLLPKWTIWPGVILNMFSYFAQSMIKLNFIFPIDTLFQVIAFLVNFFVYLLIAKITIMGINFIRGVGEIKI